MGGSSSTKLMFLLIFLGFIFVSSEFLLSQGTGFWVVEGKHDGLTEELSNRWQRPPRTVLTWGSERLGLTPGRDSVPSPCHGHSTWPPLTFRDLFTQPQTCKVLKQDFSQSPKDAAHKDLQEVVRACVLAQKQIAPVCLCGGARGVKGKLCSEKFIRDFPGGLVVKNPSANAGDTGSLPDLGRSHMPRGN